MLHCGTLLPIHRSNTMQFKAVLTMPKRKQTNKRSLYFNYIYYLYYIVCYNTWIEKHNGWKEMLSHSNSNIQMWQMRLILFQISMHFKIHAQHFHSNFRNKNFVYIKNIWFQFEFPIRENEWRNCEEYYCSDFREWLPCTFIRTYKFYSNWMVGVFYSYPFQFSMIFNIFQAQKLRFGIKQNEQFVYWTLKPIASILCRNSNKLTLFQLVLHLPNKYCCFLGIFLLR